MAPVSASHGASSDACSSPAENRTTARRLLTKWKAGIHTSPELDFLKGLIRVLALTSGSERLHTCLDRGGVGEYVQVGDLAVVVYLES